MSTGADVGKQWEHMAENSHVSAVGCLVTSADLIWLLHNSLERHKLKWWVVVTLLCLCKDKLAVISPNGADGGGFRPGTIMLSQKSPCAGSGTSGLGSTRQSCGCQGYSSEVHSGLSPQPHFFSGNSHATPASSMVTNSARDWHLRAGRKVRASKADVQFAVIFCWGKTDKWD